MMKHFVSAPLTVFAYLAGNSAPAPLRARSGTSSISTMRSNQELEIRSRVSFRAARIAVGTIYDRADAAKKPKYMALLTSDGGQHWSLKPVKEHPRSMFFLNDRSAGWSPTTASGSPKNPAGPGRRSSEQIKPDQES